MVFDRCLYLSNKKGNDETDSDDDKPLIQLKRKHIVLECGNKKICNIDLRENAIEDKRIERVNNIKINTPHDELINELKCEKREPEFKEKRKLYPATSIFNYILNDTVCDWLKYHDKSNDILTDTDKLTTNWFLNRGNTFEDDIISNIKKHIMIHEGSEIYSEEGVWKTWKLMEKGVDCIHSGCLLNPKNGTYGVADLIVRSDKLNLIIDTLPPLAKGKSKFGDFYYIVIDIKFSTIPLKSDGIHILNSRSYPAYKAQLHIYNEAISGYQKYKPRYAYVMGRGAKYTKKGISYTSESYRNKLGTVDFKEVDKWVTGRTNKALNWLKNVYDNGHKWCIDPPDRRELFPNMKRISYRYQTRKKELAEKNDEITQMWNCGFKYRDNAFYNNVEKWTDKKFNSKVLKIKGKNGLIFDQIIKVNHGNVIMIPEKIPKNLVERETNEWFVDFETFGSFLSENQIPITIFMIGALRHKGGDYIESNYEFKSFVVNEISIDEELRIMTEFYNIVKNKRNVLYHWGHIERTVWSSACKRHNVNYDLGLQWNDISLLFRNTPITIKGAFNFSLKSIGKALYNKGYINLIWEDMDNGLTAMIEAYKCYTYYLKPLETPLIKNIVNYNRIDCVMTALVLEFLRKMT
jgi:hypothetical protein